MEINLNSFQLAGLFGCFSMGLLLYISYIYSIFFDFNVSLDFNFLNEGIIEGILFTVIIILGSQSIFSILKQIWRTKK